MDQEVSHSALESDSMEKSTGKASIVCVTTLLIHQPDPWHGSAAERRVLLRLPRVYFFDDLP